MYETSLRKRWNYISKHSLYSTVWKEEQTKLQKLPKKKKTNKQNNNKINLAVCLRAKWFICNTIFKIFMVTPWWMSTKYETLCFSPFFLHSRSFVNVSPSPPGPCAALVQTTSEDRSGTESFAGLEEHIQGRKGQSVNSEARISSCSWCGHTAQNISTDGRKGWFSCLPMQCLPYFI